ncbi:MAG: hypothetical protein AMJ69_12315 [Gammaproteobacteria bacterium SG8_47]|nr:MAG: hypothetical protein AMJ69_12315 [Gammaproteobacteria bacterium SG8_47]
MVLVLILGSAAAPAADRFTDLLRERIEEIRFSPDPRVGGARIASVAVLPDFYEARGFELAWTRPKIAAELIAAVHNIAADGLDPRDYHSRELVQLTAQVRVDDTRPTPARIDLDILLTDALIRLAYHSHYGKVDPKALDGNWNILRPLLARDPVAALEAAIASDSLQAVLEALLPQHGFYRALKRALARYREIAAGGEWPQLPSGPTLRIGARDPRVVALRERLLREGYAVEGGPDPAFYDTELERAVKEFQRLHSLASDGAIGESTVAELNVTVQERIDQIRVNLERARWVLHDLQPRFVIVDIAGFEAYYYAEGEPRWSARVQVGKPYRATPVFKDAITYLVLNPTWTLPPTIIEEDVLPVVKRDPGYLQRRNIAVIDRAGKRIDPATVQWERYRGPDLPYQLVQGPGPDNSLGRIKFMFPNQHAVYLHDTPNKALFERSQRTFSSGCIRIEDPFQLAELLLDNPDNWSEQQIRAAVDVGETRTVRLPNPVTVLLLYWTVRANGDGSVRFKPDIYERDAAVLQALDGAFRARAAAPGS